MRLRAMPPASPCRARSIRAARGRLAINVRQTPDRCSVIAVKLLITAPNHQQIRIDDGEDIL